MAGKAELRELDDAALVRRFQARTDRDGAFRVLLERHGRTVYAFLRRRIGNDDTAAELHQDVLMTVFAKLDDFRGDSSFRTWLFTLARSRLWHLRRRWRVHLDEHPHDVDDAFWADLGSEGPDGDDEIGRKRVARLLRRCLAALGEVERVVVLGQYFHDMTLRELSERLALTNRSGARGPLIAAQRKLRRCLEGEGVTGVEG